jgi:hypothetical protein
MSYAVQHNLPIFPKNQVISYNGKFYINAILGHETYLGVMNTSPRKDYFAVINSYNGKDGYFKIGRLDLVDVTKKIKKDSILIEVIPNIYGGIIDFTEYIPKMKSGYLAFRAEDVRMTFFEWVASMN